MVLGIVVVQFLRPSTPMMMDSSSMDYQFINQMIPHHEDAITMSELALEKAEHEEIKTLAQSIITSQSKEIEQMQGWQKDWFSSLFISKALAHGTSHGLNMGLMGNESDLEELGNAQPFDKKFIEEMIPHHQMAVMMAQMVWNTTNREEMKQLAKNIVTAQNQEIDQMRNWYNQWYKSN